MIFFLESQAFLKFIPEVQIFQDLLDRNKN